MENLIILFQTYPLLYVFFNIIQMDTNSFGKVVVSTLIMAT